MALRVVTPPTGGLISLDEAKAHLRYEDTDQDALVTGLILAATRRIENDVQRRYLAQTIEWVRQAWDNPMILPVAPATDCQKITVDSVKYADLSGVTQTLDPSQYWAKPHGTTLKVVPRWFVIWPWLGDSAERVVIRFEITSTVSDVPDNVKIACKMLVSHMFRNRDAVVGVDNRDSSGPLPEGVEAMIDSERWSA